MRVISGSYRGKKLVAPAGSDTRPTSDRIKESLFNILANYLDFNGLIVLDICAGSGSLGIEALSRGASSCTFIENNPRAAAVIEKNIHGTTLARQSTILIKDVTVALATVRGTRHRYDVVFFDPPYSSGLYRTFISTLITADMLASDGFVIVESSARNSPAYDYDGLKLLERRMYGDTVLEIFRVEVK